MPAGVLGWILKADTKKTDHLQRSENERFFMMKKHIIPLLILSSTFILFCKKNPSRSWWKEDRRSSRSSSSSSSSEKKNTLSTFFKEVPECDDEDCCEDNRQCKSDCRQFFDDEEEACFSLPEEDGEYLLEVLDYLKDGDFDKIRIEEDLKYLHLAVDMETYTWLNSINDYNSSKADKALKWIAQYEEVTDTLMEWDEDITTDILKGLLVRAGNESFSTNDVSSIPAQDILKGLKDSKEDFLNKALKEKNNDIINFVHKHLVEDDICDTESHYPRPGGAYSGYHEQVGSIEKNTPNGKALTYQKEACILGFYCHIYSLDKADDNTNRKEMASLIDESEIDTFITTETDGGGLQTNLKVQTDASQWPVRACRKLCELWYDAVDLPLGTGGDHYKSNTCNN